MTDTMKGHAAAQLAEIYRQKQNAVHIIKRKRMMREGERRTWLRQVGLQMDALRFAYLMLVGKNIGEHPIGNPQAYQEIVS